MSVKAEIIATDLDKILLGEYLTIIKVIKREASVTGISFITEKFGESRPLCTNHFKDPENIIAKLVKDVYDAVQFGLDIHKWTASNRLGINYSDVTDIQRQDAKRFNFGDMYKISIESNILNSYKFNRKLLLLL